jgi:hypothetical protein
MMGIDLLLNFIAVESRNIDSISIENITTTTTRATMYFGAE